MYRSSDNDYNKWHENIIKKFTVDAPRHKDGVIDLKLNNLIRYILNCGSLPRPCENCTSKFLNDLLPIPLKYYLNNSEFQGRNCDLVLDFIMLCSDLIPFLIETKYVDSIDDYTSLFNQDKPLYRRKKENFIKVSKHFVTNQSLTMILSYLAEECTDIYIYYVFLEIYSNIQLFLSSTEKSNIIKSFFDLINKFYEIILKNDDIQSLIGFKGILISIYFEVNFEFQDLEFLELFIVQIMNKRVNDLLPVATELLSRCYEKRNVFGSVVERVEDFFTSQEYISDIDKLCFTSEFVSLMALIFRSALNNRTVAKQIIHICFNMLLSASISNESNNQIAPIVDILVQAYPNFSNDITNSFRDKLNDGRMLDKSYTIYLPIAVLKFMGKDELSGCIDIVYKKLEDPKYFDRIYSVFMELYKEDTISTTLKNELIKESYKFIQNEMFNSLPIIQHFVNKNNITDDYINLLRNQLSNMRNTFISPILSFLLVYYKNIDNFNIKDISIFAKRKYDIQIIEFLTKLLKIKANCVFVPEDGDCISSILNDFKLDNKDVNEEILEFYTLIISFRPEPVIPIDGNLIICFLLSVRSPHSELCLDILTKMYSTLKNKHFPDFETYLNDNYELCYRNNTLFSSTNLSRLILNLKIAYEGVIPSNSCDGFTNMKKLIPVLLKFIISSKNADEQKYAWKVLKIIDDFTEHIPPNFNIANYPDNIYINKLKHKSINGIVSNNRRVRKSLSDIREILDSINANSCSYVLPRLKDIPVSNFEDTDDLLKHFLNISPKYGLKYLKFFEKVCQATKKSFSIKKETLERAEKVFTGEAWKRFCTITITYGTYKQTAFFLIKDRIKLDYSNYALLNMMLYPNNKTQISLQSCIKSLLILNYNQCPINIILELLKDVSKITDKAEKYTQLQNFINIIFRTPHKALIGEYINIIDSLKDMLFNNLIFGCLSNITIESWGVVQDDFTPRGDKPVGLTDYGNRFINCVILMMFHLKPFRHMILSLEEKRLNSFTNSLKSLFFNMMFTSSGFCDARDVIKSALNKDNNSDFEYQQNTRDFLSKIFSLIPSHISKMFSGGITTYYQGIDVSFTHKVEENFNVLPISINNCQDILESFKALNKEDILSGPKKYKSEYGLTDAKTFSRVTISPDVLFIELDRFVTDGNGTLKNNSIYKYYDELKGKDIMLENDYELHGVIVHSGSMNSGLYSAIIKINDIYVKFDDKNVTEGVDVFREGYGNGTENKPNSYILVYVATDYANKYSTDEIVMTPNMEVSNNTAEAYFALDESIIMFCIDNMNLNHLLRYFLNIYAHCKSIRFTQAFLKKFMLFDSRSWCEELMKSTPAVLKFVSVCPTVEFVSVIKDVLEHVCLKCERNRLLTLADVLIENQHEFLSTPAIHFISYYVFLIYKNHHLKNDLVAENIVKIIGLICASYKEDNLFAEISFKYYFLTLIAIGEYFSRDVLRENYERFLLNDKHVQELKYLVSVRQPDIVVNDLKTTDIPKSAPTPEKPALYQQPMQTPAKVDGLNGIKMLYDQLIGGDATVQRFLLSSPEYIMSCLYDNEEECRVLTERIFYLLFINYETNVENPIYKVVDKVVLKPFLNSFEKTTEVNASDIIKVIIDKCVAIFRKDVTSIFNTLLFLSTICSKTQQYDFKSFKSHIPKTLTWQNYYKLVKIYANAGDVFGAIDRYNEILLMKNICKDFVLNTADLMSVFKDKSSKINRFALNQVLAQIEKENPVSYNKIKLLYK